MKTAPFRLFMLALLLSLPKEGQAQQLCRGIPANEYHSKYTRQQIEDAIKKGKDPCPEIIPQGGVYSGLAKGATSMISRIGKGGNMCPPTLTKDRTCGVDNTLTSSTYGKPVYPNCTSRSGGASSGGSLSVCAPGLRLLTNQLPVMPYRIPDIDFPFGFMDCWTNLFRSVTSASTTTALVGTFISNVDITGNANASTSGGCGGGQIGFCNFSAFGKICTANLNGQQSGGGGGPLFFQMDNGGSFVMSWKPPDVRGPVTLIDGGSIEGLALPRGTRLELSPYCPNTIGVFKAGGGYQTAGAGTINCQSVTDRGNKCDPLGIYTGIITTNGPVLVRYHGSVILPTAHISNPPPTSYFQKTKCGATP